MEVILNYDPITGNITDKNGMFIYSIINLQYKDVVNNSNLYSVADITLLKEAGLSIEEIIQLKEVTK